MGFIYSFLIKILQFFQQIFDKTCLIYHLAFELNISKIKKNTFRHVKFKFNLPKKNVFFNYLRKHHKKKRKQFYQSNKII